MGFDVVAFIVFSASGIALSALVLSLEWFRRSTWLLVIGMTWSFMWMLGIWIPLASVQLSPVAFLTHVGMSGIGAVLHWPFAVAAFAQIMAATASAMISDGQINVRKTYDRAEKAERAGDLEGAAALYEAEAKQDPEDGEALRRLGEILMRIEAYEDAAESFRVALPRMEEPGEKCAVALRLADVLVGNLGRRDEAVAVLQDVCRDAGETREAEAIRLRLEALGSGPAKSE